MPDPSANPPLYERELRIDAQAETVFAAFTDPARMQQWMGRSAELDPRPGGLFRVDVNGNDIARGEYVEVVPHTRIVFTWGWESPGHPLPPGASRVEITLTPDGEGTLLRMVHSGFPNAELAGRHSEGWDHYLGRLAEAAAGRDPGPDAWAASQPAPERASS